MPKILTQAQIDQFREQGFVSPIRVMSAAEALGYRSRLERFEHETSGPLGGHLRHKTHLLFTWLADLVRHPRILDAVEDLYGPDLLCWTTNFLSRRRPTRPSSSGTRIQPIGA
jgi:non-heme Fe2+,alpha-ketoglutarate-dependent halogenase